MEKLIDNIVNAYQKELVQNENSKLKGGSYHANSDGISFLTKRGEALVIRFTDNIDTIATLKGNVIQMNEYNAAKLKESVHYFTSQAQNKAYWTALEQLIDKSV